MVPLKLAVLVLCIVAVGLGKSIKYNAKDVEKDIKQSITSALKDMPKEDKNDLVAYLLALGLKDYIETQQRRSKSFPQKNSDAFLKRLDISEDKIKKFQKMDIPKDYSKKLLDWTKKEFKLSTKNVMEMILTKKRQGPHFIGLPDVGEMCCPW